MTINVTKCSNVTVNGTHNHTNCKPVYNITTGAFYASGLDIAKTLGVDPASVSAALNGKIRTVKGCRICFVSKIMEHLEEINEQNRIRAERDRMNAERMTERDAENAKLEVIRNARAKVTRHNARVAELEAELTNERRIVEEAEAEFKKACEEV